MSAHPVTTIEAADVTIPADHGLRKVPRIAAVVGGTLLLAAAVAGMGEPARLAAAYLVAFTFFLSLALGALFFVLVHHAARAGWSVVVRRLAEHVMGTLPWFALLFVPILVGMNLLFHHWTAHGETPDPVLEVKAPYLNVPFFVVRAVVFLGAWALMARAFRRGSLAQDESGDHAISRRLRRLAGPCIVVFAFTVTFAAFDWLMSLDPHWYSTIFGGYYFSGAVVGFFALLAFLVVGLEMAGVYGRGFTTGHLHDIGNLLFAFTVFWAYVGFSQFMLIWYANLPEETIFFEHRFEGSWMGVSFALMIGHFIVPFFYLMPRTIKRKRPALIAGAAWMLLVHFLDLHWLVMPGFEHGGFHLRAVDVLAVLGLGAIFVAVLARQLGQGALVPLRDPRLAESLASPNA